VFSVSAALYFEAYNQAALLIQVVATLILPLVMVLRCEFIELILPDFASGFHSVKFSSVRLEVEQRGSIQDVNPLSRRICHQKTSSLTIIA
jgi:hypothetical protein